MASDLFSIEGKTALVTGGTRGIGLMIARGFVEAGANVYVSSRKAEVCEEVAAELSKVGSCTGLPANLSTEEECKRLADEIAGRESALHILVNNAGANWGAPLADFDDAAWDRVLDLNLKGVFHLTKFLVPLLETAGSHDDPARVINIGSIDGIQVPMLDTFSYSASKAAVHQMTRVLAKHLAPKHIAVNAIAPGPFESKIGEAVLAARLVVRLALRRAVGVPVVGVVVGRVAVHDALVASQVARVGADLGPVEDVDVPADLVELGVVGVVSGLDRERQRLAGHRARPDPVDLADHGLGDLGRQHFLGSVGRPEDPGDRVAGLVLVVVPVDVLHPHRRLGVEDVDVAELGEREQWLAAPGPAAPRGGPEVGAHDVRLAGGTDDRAVAARARPAPAQGRVEGGPAGGGDAGHRFGRESTDDGRTTEGPGGAEEVATSELHACSTIRVTGRHALSTAAASSTVSTRCRYGSMPRPRASAFSSGHAGTSVVQYVDPTSTIGATDDSSA
jgi:NAD(P)-dependent dehydrogenase (short-subunit alcohol dehydrogenase family)